MKIITTAVLAIIPFMFGCATTPKESYSAEFKAYPVETKYVGTVHTNSMGDVFTIPQNYRFECVLNETVQSPDGEATTRVLASPYVETGIGFDARIAVMGAGIDDGGSTFEVQFDERESEFRAHLTATYKEPGSDPVSRSETIIIKK